MSNSILIVDDEPLARKVIREFVDKMDNSTEIIEAQDSIEAQKIISERHLDIIFLDINMPLMSGIELAESNELRDPLIIFTTAYVEHAVKAFELEAFDYLVKPISFSRFQKSFNRAIEHLASNVSSESSWMMVKEGKRIYKVPHAEIRHLQAYGDYVKIFSSSKTYLMKTKLSALLSDLPDTFIRCHRSYVVNAEHIKYIEGNHVEIVDEKVPISESYRHELMSRL